MVGLFSKKSRKSTLKFVDFDGQPLKEGDVVMSMRYELGECRIINTENGMAYESLSGGQQVSYIKMIDAATGYQKVKRLES